MIIDIIFLVVIVAAIIKGFRKGLVVAVFSLLAFVIGLAAALKLSAVVAGMLDEKTDISSKWLPVLSFAIVFIAVVISVNLLGKLIEKSLELAFMGWMNHVGGMVFYVLIYTFIFSIALFYADQLHFIGEGTRKSSMAYSYIEPMAPVILDWLSYIFPFLKNVFHDLEQFFGRLAQRT